jgi:hypothetical protein
MSMEISKNDTIGSVGVVRKVLFKLTLEEHGFKMQTELKEAGVR